MMVLLLCLSVIGVNEFSVFANNVVVKADSRSKTEFFPYSYQAEDYLERCSVSEKLFNTISPSQTMYDAGVESGLAVSAAVWDSFTTLLDSFNKPSSMADKAFEKKDLYAGLFLSIFECEYKADTKARMDMSQIKNMNSLYKQFDSFCKANDYIYAASDKILFSDMSQVQKERLLSLTNTLADTDKDGDVWMSAMGNVDKALKVMDVLNDVEKWCTYIMNCILLNDLNENTKQVLEDMYQESLKTGNLDMSLAFKESLDIAQASGVELASEITENFALEFTKKAAQEIIDTFWGDIKKSAQAANPYIAAFWLAYDGSKLLVKLVFNSDNITEKYCKMDALLQIRKVASAVYEKEKNTYKSTKNESDAAAFIASRDIMYECINVDCECASEYVDSVSNALWQKIITLFKECNNLTELKRQIKSIQDSINSTHKTVQLNWIFWLQDDYPEEYENYKSLLVDYLPSVTMPKTSASVNVGEKIDLGGYVLSDPCKFLDGKIKESWSTTNSKVAVVNSMGVVSAIKEGTAIISLRFLDSSGNEIDGIYQDCTVTVKNLKISLNKTKTTLYVGDSEVLKATLNGGSGKVTWSSSNKSVVTVSAGKIVAKKKGTATITAKVDGASTKCTVTVKKRESSSGANYKKLYKKFLEQSQIKIGSSSIQPKWYYVLNIDKKGVPELIVCYGGPIAEYYVYTVKNNKVKYLGECIARGISIDNPQIYYVPSQKGLSVSGWTNGIGGAWSNLFVISNSKLVQKRHIMSYFDSNGKEVYQVGTTADTAKNVTKAIYNNYYNKYFKDQKEYTAIQNIETNRNKSFD